MKEIKFQKVIFFALENRVVSREQNKKQKGARIKKKEVVISESLKLSMSTRIERGIKLIKDKR